MISAENDTDSAMTEVQQQMRAFTTKTLGRTKRLFSSNSDKRVITEKHVPAFSQAKITQQFESFTDKRDSPNKNMYSHQIHGFGLNTEFTSAIHNYDKGPNQEASFQKSTPLLKNMVNSQDENLKQSKIMKPKKKLSLLSISRKPSNLIISMDTARVSNTNEIISTQKTTNNITSRGENVFTNNYFRNIFSGVDVQKNIAMKKIGSKKSVAIRLEDYTNTQTSKVEEKEYIQDIIKNKNLLNQFSSDVEDKQMHKRTNTGSYDRFKNTHAQTFNNSDRHFQVIEFDDNISKYLDVKRYNTLSNTMSPPDNKYTRNHTQANRYSSAKNSARNHNQKSFSRLISHNQIEKKSAKTNTLPDDNEDKNNHFGNHKKSNMSSNANLSKYSIKKNNFMNRVIDQNIEQNFNKSKNYLVNFPNTLVPYKNH